MGCRVIPSGVLVLRTLSKSAPFSPACTACSHSSKLGGGKSCSRFNLISLSTIFSFSIRKTTSLSFMNLSYFLATESTEFTEIFYNSLFIFIHHSFSPLFSGRLTPCPQLSALRPQDLSPSRPQDLKTSRRLSPPPS